MTHDNERGRGPKFDGLANQAPSQGSIDLRDWFAGLALVGLLSDDAGDFPPARTAEEAYEIATEMLKARRVVR